MLAAQTSSFESIVQLIGVLLIFVFVLGITYFTTRWIANYQRGHSFNRNLKVVETLKITTNKYIQMIEAGDEYLVIAIGKDEVRLLTKLTKEQLKKLPSEEEFSVQPAAGSFKDILDRWKEHMSKK